MGFGGLLAGGIISGIGRGMEMTANQARDMALENLRNQRTIEAEKRGEVRTIETEKRADTRAMANDYRDGAIKEHLLEVASKNKRMENESDFDYKVRLARIAGEEDRKTAGYKSRLDINRDALNEQQKADLDGGKINGREVSDDGYLVLVYNDGRPPVKTDQKVRAPASATVNPKDVVAARAQYQDDLRKWGYKKIGPQPKPQDYGLESSSENGSENSSSKGKDSSSNSGANWYAPNSSPSPKGGKTIFFFFFCDAARAAGKSEAEMRSYAASRGFRIE